MEYVLILIVFVMGAFVSSFGTLIGGGAFIVIPALIFMGLPPHVAIGTNKVGALGLFIGGWYAFSRKGVIDYKLGWLMVPPGILGSIIGSLLVFELNETILKQVIAILTIGILLVIFFQPDLGVKHIKEKITRKEYVAGFILFFFIYVYMGFYGAGAGTFLVYVLILLFGQTFIESAATNKIASLASMIISVSVFVINGAINYQLGLALFSGCMVGSYLGGQFSDKIGNVWIKRAFFALVLFLSIKLLF